MYGINALLHGAMAVLVTLPLLLVPFWRMTRPLAAGARALRPFVSACAAFGLSMAAGGIWALNGEPAGYADEAIAGSLILGGVLALLGFLILCCLPHRRGPA